MLVVCYAFANYFVTTQVNQTTGSLRDKHFSEWFASDCILTNMRTVIAELQSLEEVEDFEVQESHVGASKAITYISEEVCPASPSTSGWSFFLTNF